LIADLTVGIEGRDGVTGAQGTDGGTMAGEQRTSLAYLGKDLRPRRSEPKARGERGKQGKLTNAILGGVERTETAL